MSTDLNVLGGRKFIIALVAIVGTILLMWYGKIDDGVYSAVVIATVGAYIAGNVTQKANDDKKAEVVTPTVTK